MIPSYLSNCLKRAAIRMEQDTKIPVCRVQPSAFLQKMTPCTAILVYTEGGIYRVPRKSSGVYRSIWTFGHPRPRVSCADPQVLFLRRTPTASHYNFSADEKNWIQPSSILIYSPGKQWSKRKGVPGQLGLIRRNRSEMVDDSLDITPQYWVS